MLDLIRFAQRLRHAPFAAALAWGAALSAPSAHAQSVVFINPGKTGEVFWESAAAAMHSAARSLGMQLEVQMAERNRLAPIAMAKALAERPAAQRPDYVIFTNDYSVAPAVLRALEHAGIRSFIAFSGIPAQLHAQTGKPRSQHPLWLGSLEPHAQDGGYLTAKALIEQGLRNRLLPKGPDGRLQMVAIAGDRSTPSSVERNAGMQRAVQEFKDQVQLMQEVYGDWRADKAQEQMLTLHTRYPQARLVWSGSDQMAFGAMQAWKDADGTPGKDALFSGINTSQAAFDALTDGSLSALAGGHVLCGAWSMVMLHDHYKGIDFASEGLELKQRMFVLFTPRTAQAFAQRLGLPNSPMLDFKPFSKVHNKALKAYNFDVNLLLR